MPFILLTLKEGEIIKDYWRNNRKHQRHKERTESIFGFDDETEIKHAEVRSNNDPIEEIIRNEDRRNVNRALALLSQKQRTRIIKHFYDNKSLGEIAGEEGVNKNAVAKSVEQALKIMKNFFENAADGYALLSRRSMWAAAPSASRSFSSPHGSSIMIPISQHIKRAESAA